MRIATRKVLSVAVIIACVCACLGAGNPAEQVLPADRCIDWRQAGVPGGIPNRTTIFTKLSPGATAAQISAALAACPKDQVVFLNAGTYNLSTGITFGTGSRITLRGAGPDKTILVFAACDPCGGLHADVGVAGSELWEGNVLAKNIRDWTAGYTKGSTQITLSSAAGIAPGTLLILDQLDDATDTGGILVSDAKGAFSIEGGAPGRRDRHQQQFVMVTAVNGNQLTINPGLHMPNWRASQKPQAWFGGSSVMNGIEDLTLDHAKSDDTCGIAFHNVCGGWVKNIRSFNANRNHVWLQQASRIEVRDSYFYGTKHTASQSYGVEFFTTSDDLVVNNVFYHVTAPIMLGPCSGSVIACNYTFDMVYYVPTWMASGISASHDAGTGMNLFEGNLSNGVGMDLFHGTGNCATFFRNRLTGTEPGKKQGNTVCIHLFGYNRFVNVVGNVLGTPKYHTTYEGSRAPTGKTGHPDKCIYLLGYAGGNEEMAYAGIKYDPLTSSTMFRWGNFDVVTNDVRWDPAELGGGTVTTLPTRKLPASLFFAAKPAWWGNLPWPAYGPDPANPAAVLTGKLPAETRFEAMSERSRTSSGAAEASSPAK